MNSEITKPKLRQQIYSITSAMQVLFYLKFGEKPKRDKNSRSPSMSIKKDKKEFKHTKITLIKNLTKPIDWHGGETSPSFS